MRDPCGSVRRRHHTLLSTVTLAGWQGAKPRTHTNALEVLSSVPPGRFMNELVSRFAATPDWEPPLLLSERFRVA